MRTLLEIGTMNTQSTTEHTLIQRIESLERANRRMKFAGGALMCALIAVVALGFKPSPLADPVKIDADEVRARTVFADTFIVRNAKGEIRIDKTGLLMRSPKLSTINRSKITEYENRIEIGFDEEWAQENLYQPTPRIAVGRWGKDTSDNVVTRITAASPEGLHSGEWHTNNPRIDGRTDHDLIEAIKSRK